MKIKDLFRNVARSITPKGLCVGIACIAVIVLCICLIPHDCDDGASPSPSPTAETSPLPAETPSAQSTFRRATLYYLSDEGFIVPVTKLIPHEEGIARACLGYITSSEENDAAASAMGLSTVIPAGVQLELSIGENGCALLNLIGLPDLGSAEREQAFVTAVVNTLLEFPTIASVTINLDGKYSESLPHGTHLPKDESSCPLNVEDSELATSGSAFAMRLYFPNRSGAYVIPITRYTSSAPTLYSCVSALIGGSGSTSLLDCFPAGTLLLGAAIENGILTINLSDDFTAVEDVSGLFTLCYETLCLTAAELYDFDDLVIQVNGTVYSPEPVTIPMYAND